MRTRLRQKSATDRGSKTLIVRAELYTHIQPLLNGVITRKGIMFIMIFRLIYKQLRNVLKSWSGGTKNHINRTIMQLSAEVDNKLSKDFSI